LVDGGHGCFRLAVFVRFLTGPTHL
jgi:hypothetical protein